MGDLSKIFKLLSAVEASTTVKVKETRYSKYTDIYKAHNPFQKLNSGLEIRQRPKPRRIKSESSESDIERSLRRTKKTIADYMLCNDFDLFATFTLDKLKVKDGHDVDAIKEIKKPKIAKLQTLLSPALERAGYIEFGLDKPEIGKDVFVGFSYLDGKSDRAEYDSRKTPEKLVKKTLEDTNWRLMSEGILYRLGYLNARLRAYEREEDLKRLVSKKNNLKLGKSSSNEKNAWSIQDDRGKDIIL